MTEFFEFLRPKNAAEFWTAASAIGTLLAVLVAFVSARYAALGLRLGQTPVVNLLRVGGQAQLVSVGAGVALNVLLVGDDGRIIASAPTHTLARASRTWTGAAPHWRIKLGLLQGDVQLLDAARLGLALPELLDLDQDRPAALALGSFGRSSRGAIPRAPGQSWWPPAGCGHSGRLACGYRGQR